MKFLKVNYRHKTGKLCTAYVVQFSTLENGFSSWIPDVKRWKQKPWVERRWQKNWSILRTYRDMKFNNFTFKWPHLKWCAWMLSHCSSVWLFVTLWTVATRLLCLWDSPDKNTGVGCHAFLQEIFLTYKLNPCFLHLLHWQAGSLHTEPLRKPFFIVFMPIWNYVFIWSYMSSTLLRRI